MENKTFIITWLDHNSVKQIAIINATSEYNAKIIANNMSRIFQNYTIDEIDTKTPITFID